MAQGWGQYHTVYGHECATWLRALLADAGLVKILTQLHGMAAALATHQCRWLPINGIYVSHHLQDGAKAGYFAFGKGVPSDH